MALRRWIMASLLVIAASAGGATEAATGAAAEVQENSASNFSGEVEATEPSRLESLSPTFSSHSEFFHQDAAHTTHVELSPSYRSGSETFTQVNAQNQLVSGEHDKSSTAFGVTGSHGWNSVLKSSMNLSFSESDSVRSSSDRVSRDSYHYSGVNDLEFGTQAMLAFEQISAFLGANAWISPTSHQVATVSMNGNEFSGGQSVMPYVGLELAVSRWRLGGSFGYRYMGPRTFESHSPRSSTIFQATETGGDSLGAAVFSEFHMHRQVVGLAITGDSYSSAVETASPRSNAATNGVINYSSYTEAKFTAYGVWNLEKFEVLPTVSYTDVFTQNHDGVNDSANSDLSISLSGRIAL